MAEARIATIGELEGEEVILKGWLYSRRSSGGVHFLLIRDGTGVMQGVVTKERVDEKTFQLCDHIPQESSLVVKGMVRADKRAPGGYELAVSQLDLIQEAQEYPITPKEHGVSFLLDHRHLWLRSSRPNAILRVRAEVIRACRDFFDSRGFVLVDAPIFTPSACEGTTTLFEVDYFGHKAYLTQSGQLYNEAAALALGKVYCFGPTFRAEKSKTRRHLTEFWQIEPEMAFADLNDVMDLSEKLTLYLVERVLESNREELKILERDLTPLESIASPFPKITYTEAVDILEEEGVEFTWGDDFGAPHESALSCKFTCPVMVHRFAAKCKPFYMKRDPENEDLALGVDVLAPEGYGEIIGGGEREDSLEVLEKRLEEQNLPKDDFQWYLDLRRYGSVPHGGFGLGIERTVAWLCKLHHLRETIPFPRMLERAYP